MTNAPGHDDLVDPAPPRRLSRKNLVALGLSAVGVILVLFFSSQPGRDRPPAPPPPADPAVYGGVAPITVEASSDVPPPPDYPTGNPWGSGPAPGQWSGEGGEGATAVEARRQLFEQARKSRTLIYEAGSPAEAPPRAAADDDSDGDLLRDALAPLSALGLAAGGQTGPAPGPRGWQSTTTGQPVGYGQHVLRQGSVIHAALETAVNTDRPGPVIARVARPVRDSYGFRHVLIPAGTKMLGVMRNTPPGFRDGVVVAWTRLQFSDGRVLELPGFPSAETTGGQGIAESVDKHRMGRFGAASLLALMGAGATYATAQAASSTTGLAGAALGVELARMGGATATRRMQRQPTVKVSPGYRFLVYVSDDVMLDAVPGR